jgi:hypothetical protein
MVIHKPARECPIAEPHPRTTCGIVKARERRQIEMDAGMAARPRNP